MIDYLSNNIAIYFAKNKIIDADDVDLYKYGAETFFSSLIGTLIVLILGLSFGLFYQSIAFVICFCSLRSFCGGYHANSYFKCNIQFGIIVFSVLFLLKYILTYQSVLFLYADVFCLIIISWLAPIKNINKVLTDKEALKCKLISISICSFLVVLSIIFFIINSEFSIVISIAMLVVTLLMIIEKIKQRSLKNERC